MEMSAAYLAETVGHLRKAGYDISESKDTKQRGDEVIFDRTRYQCKHAPTDVDVTLEAICYADGREAYFLEINKLGAMRSFSFPLDSWKFRPATVEFKYYVHPESSLGLSFVLTLPAPA